MKLRRDHRTPEVSSSRGPFLHSVQCDSSKTAPPSSAKDPPGTRTSPWVSACPHAGLHPTPQQVPQGSPVSLLSSPPPLQLLKSQRVRELECGGYVPRRHGVMTSSSPRRRVPPGPSRPVPVAAAPAGKSLRAAASLRLLPPPSGPTEKGRPPIGRAEEKHSVLS